MTGSDVLMNQRTLKVLEYEKIILMLKELCQSPLGNQLAEELKPYSNLLQIKEVQNETAEAEALILHKGAFQLGGLSDVSFLIKKADVGSVLDPAQLLTVKRQLTLARRAKSHMTTYEKKNESNLLKHNVEQI